MKILLYITLFLNILFAKSQQTVYFYTTDTNINNFKSLKISFDKYLSDFGDYTFQPFNNKSTFENYLKNDNLTVIVSSWHYTQIAPQYNLKANLVGSKNNTIKDTKILVGQRDMEIDGVVTSAYDKSYTSKLLDQFDTELSILVVPKEIDALMSVGFGMSNFALVSKDSFKLLKHINPILADNLTIYNESEPMYRMILANNNDENKLTSIFENMGLRTDGKKILNQIGIDKLIKIPKNDLDNLGGLK